jgi:RNA polymerase sigma factor (sigma-70 family)
LYRALEQQQPDSVGAFFALAARQIRWVLLDMARRHDRQPTSVPLSGSTDSGNEGGRPLLATSSDDPARLAMWAEFHRAVGELPEPEREVFEYHWYLGMSEAEIARVLGLHERKVSRLWIRAVRKLPSVPDCRRVRHQPRSCW